MMWNGGHGMMGWGGWGFGMLHMLLSVAVLVLFIAFIVSIFSSRPSSRDRNYRPEGQSSGLAILEERYARGEIGRDEYIQKKKDLLT